MVIRFDSLFAALTRLVYLAVVAVPFLTYLELPNGLGDYFPAWKVKAVLVLWLFLEFVVVRYETPWQFAKDIIGGPVGAASWVVALLAPTIGGYFWGTTGFGVGVLIGKASWIPYLGAIFWRILRRLESALGPLGIRCGNVFLYAAIAAFVAVTAWTHVIPH